jgi:hypothetical protein
MAGLLLGPALLLTPVLGKMIAGKHKYEQGLRYAAWERTAWHESRPRHVTTPAVKSAADLASEVQSRIYGRSGAPIRADDRGRTREQDRPQDYILYRPLAVANGSQRRGYVPWTPNRVNDNQRPVYTDASQARSRLTGMASNGQEAALQLLSLTSFRLDTRSVYTTRLSTDLEDLSRYNEFRVNADRNGQPLNLRLDQENGRPRQLLLLADGWSAARREHAAEQSRALVPTRIISDLGLGSVLNAIGIIPFARELRDLEFGHVDTEQTPRHRLGTYQ